MCPMVISSHPSLQRKGVHNELCPGPSLMWICLCRVVFIGESGWFTYTIYLTMYFVKIRYLKPFLFIRSWQLRIKSIKDKHNCQFCSSLMLIQGHDRREFTARRQNESRETDLNRRPKDDSVHQPLQSSALPTELSRELQYRNLNTKQWQTGQWS